MEKYHVYGWESYLKGINSPPDSTYWIDTIPFTIPSRLLKELKSWYEYLYGKEMDNSQVTAVEEKEMDE